MWAGLPCQRIWPAVGCHRPEMVLIVTDLPAPLSPTSAVILPAGTERLTLSRAWTAPNDLLTPRSSRSGTSSVMWAPIATTTHVCPCFQWPTPAPSPGPGVGLEVTSFRWTLPRPASRSAARYPLMPAALHAEAYEPA